MSSRADLLEAALWVGLMIVTVVTMARCGGKVVHRDWIGMEANHQRKTFRSTWCAPLVSLVDGTWL